MSFSIFEQANILVYSAFFGCICGAVSALYRCFYISLRKKALRIAADFFISMLFSAAYFIFVIVCCKGRVSIYQIAFLLIGAFVSKNIAGFAVSSFVKIKKTIFCRKI